MTNYVSASSRDYLNIRDELTVSFEGEVINSKVVVPATLQTQMLNRIYYAHFGVTQCILRTKDVIYWLGMTVQIEEFVLWCSVCHKNKKRNPKQPLKSHETPNPSWAKVGDDLLVYKNNVYLMCVDYFSKYLEIVKLSNLSNKMTIYSSEICLCQTQHSR